MSGFILVHSLKDKSAFHSLSFLFSFLSSVVFPLRTEKLFMSVSQDSNCSHLENRIQNAETLSSSSGGGNHQKIHQMDSICICVDEVLPHIYFSERFIFLLLNY